MRMSYRVKHLQSMTLSDEWKVHCVWWHKIKSIVQFFSYQYTFIQPWEEILSFQTHVVPVFPHGTENYFVKNLHSTLDIMTILPSFAIIDVRKALVLVVELENEMWELRFCCEYPTQLLLYSFRTLANNTFDNSFSRCNLVVDNNEDK